MLPIRRTLPLALLAALAAPAAQAEVPILPGDTEETLQARTLIAEHKLYAQALTMIANGEASFPPSSS